MILLPAVCWMLLVSLATATELASSRLQQDAIAASHSDLVVLTSASFSGNERSADGALATLLDSYTSAAANRVWARSDAWQVVRDTAVDGAVWARLKHKTSGVFACVAVSTSATNASDVRRVAGRVESFCSSQDVLLLGFAAPLSSAAATFVRGESTVDGKQIERATVDLADLARQKPTLGDVSSAQRRLYLHVPLTTCLEDASATASSLVTAFRFGADCEQTPRAAASPSGAANETITEQTPKRSDKRALIVLLSCGTFLLGCGIIFYIFFRKQFFMPSESSKPEKELTTNLAYVLRM
ncbi:hypothetical protein PINS_up003750 [Pythium insidiosum]|nr:hypothetical protein PINS_up003750 [Pythium insidiosum]